MANITPLNGGMKLPQAWPIIDDNIRKINAEVTVQGGRINNIVSNSGDDITEIVDAREDYGNLRERLDTEKATVMSQLAEKATKTELASKVSITANETISGAKTFTNKIIAQLNVPIEMYNPAATVDANRYAFSLSDGIIRLFALNSAGGWQRNLLEFSHDSSYAYFGNGNIKLMYGSSVPEGNIAATSGALYMRPNTPARLFYKETGTGNTGWKEIITTSKIMYGEVAPNGNATADVGTIYINTIGTTATTILYLKTSGSGTNTGWTAK